MAKGKGIENIISEQTQIGFLQKLKKKLSHKAVTYGLAFSLLFPLARRALADTIYQKTHELEFLLPGAIYGKKQNPTTQLEVRVDCDKVAEKEYELKLSFFAKDWDISKNHIEDFVFINNILSNFYLVYPNGVAVGEPKESAYIISRKHGNKKIGGEWKDLVPLELSARTQLKLGLLKVGIKVASTAAGFMLAGPLGAGIGLAASFASEARTLYDNVNEAKRKAMLVNAYGGTVSEIPFYPADKDISARTFTIPIEVGDSKEEKDIELNMLLDVGLKRGSVNNEEYGQLRDLPIKVSLKESVNYNADKEEPEKPEKSVEEEQSIEDVAEKPKQQPQSTEQAVKKEGSLEVKVDSEPARGNLDKNILGNLEKKVIVDDGTSFYIPISVPQGKEELDVTFSRKEDSKFTTYVYLYYPSGKEACEGRWYYDSAPSETLNVKSPHAGKYVLEIRSGVAHQIDISSNCPIEEPKYQVNGSVKGGDVMFYAIDVNETNSAEPLLCRLDWENSGHPISIELYDPASPSTENNSPKGLSDISICKTSPSAGKWILAVKGSFAEGGLEKFILQSYHHKIEGLRCEKHEEFIYTGDKKIFSYNQQKDGNLLMFLKRSEEYMANTQLFYPNGKNALGYTVRLSDRDPLIKAFYFPFAPAGEYKTEVDLVSKSQKLEVYFVSSQNAYPIENTEINKNESNKEKSNKN